MAKRIIVWLVILLTPSALWLSLTEDGRWVVNHYLQDSKPVTQTNSPVPVIETPMTVTSADKPGPILIPVHPETVTKEPALKVQLVLGKRQTHSTTPHIGMLIMDSQNRKSGYDSFTKQEYADIPYSTFDISKSNDAGKPFSALAIIDPAQDTQFTLEITGNPGGNYQLRISGVSPSGERITEISQHRLPSNRSHLFKINLNNVRSLGFNRNQSLQRLDTAKRFVSESETIVKVTKKESLNDICKNIQLTLSAIKNTSLTKNIIKEDNGQELRGCAFILSGHSKQVTDTWYPPDLFYPYVSSAAFLDGWVPSMEADGPDATSFQINKQDVYCMISGDWDGGLDDDPSYIPSDEFEVSVECNRQSNI